MLNDIFGEGGGGEIPKPKFGFAKPEHSAGHQQNFAGMSQTSVELIRIRIEIN
jgi:hypothetical protein